MKKGFLYFINLLIIMLLSINLFSQENNTPATDEEAKTTEKMAIQGEYRGVKLGMTRSEVLDILLKDPYLEIDEQTDYGNFDEEQNYLIKAKRVPYINYIYYQFYKPSDSMTTTETPPDTTGTPSPEENMTNNEPNQEGWILYAIIIEFNVKYNNYISLYNTLVSKYGLADVRTAKFSIWSPEGRTIENENIQVKLILNAPSTIKIINNKVFNEKFVEKKQVEKEALKTYEEKMNEELLSDFTPSTGEKTEESTDTTTTEN